MNSYFWDLKRQLCHCAILHWLGLYFLFRSYLRFNLIWKTTEQTYQHDYPILKLCKCTTMALLRKCHKINYLIFATRNVSNPFWELNQIFKTPFSEEDKEDEFYGICLNYFVGSVVVEKPNIWISKLFYIIASRM